MILRTGMAFFFLLVPFVFCFFLFRFRFFFFERDCLLYAICNTMRGYAPVIGLHLYLVLVLVRDLNFKFLARET